MTERGARDRPGDRRSGRILDGWGGERDGFRLVVGAISGGAAASIAAIIVTRRFLYADSSYFLLRMWEDGSFFIANPSRWFGFVASQWLPVGAMKVGVVDAGAIATLFGANLWLNPVLAVLAAWWASGGSREITLVVLLGVLLLFQSTYIVLDNESNVFFWLASILFILTLRRDYSYAALALLLPIAFTHEVAILAFLPVLAILLARRERYIGYYGSGRFWLLVAGLGAVTAWIGWRSVAADAGPNRTYFIEGALSLPTSPSLMLTLLAFGSLAALAFRPRHRALTIVFWSSTALLLVLPFAFPEWVWPFYHYRARILNAGLALLLFLFLHGRVHGNLPPATGLLTRRVLWLAGVVFVFQGAVTREWDRHRSLFRAELADAPGIVDFPVQGPFAEPRARQYSWSWTSPTRSIVFQAITDGDVRTIMLNADTTLWQPFDPRVPADLPDLSGLGIGYGAGLTGGSP